MKIEFVFHAGYCPMIELIRKEPHVVPGLAQLTCCRPPAVSWCGAPVLAVFDHLCRALGMKLQSTIFSL